MEFLRWSNAFLLLFTASLSHAQDSKSGLDVAFANVEPKVIAWRHDIHQNPCLLYTSPSPRDATRAGGGGWGW